MDSKIETLISRHTDSLVRLKRFKHFVGTEHMCYKDEMKIEARVRSELEEEFKRSPPDEEELGKICNLYKGLLRMKICSFNQEISDTAQVTTIGFDLSKMLGNKTKQNFIVI